MLNQKLMGKLGEEKTYVEDVFSTYLYTGNGSTQTITNGIDLAGKGGMVWLKSRNSASYNHILCDYQHPNVLSSDLTQGDPLGSNTAFISSFNNNGFSLTDNIYPNNSGTTYASWTFRKAPKFFDVVTYTGNGTAGNVINHSLGQVPGMIIVKNTTSAGGWVVYHRSLTSTKAVLLNSTNPEVTTSLYWNNTEPTSTTFTVGASGSVNANNDTMVAYLFAHDTTTDGMIQCGSYTTNGSGVGTVNLGWEPQYVMIKSASGSSEWGIYDSMRGFSLTAAQRLKANAADAEAAMGAAFYPTATGFVDNASTAVNATMIYMAIRRPMKVPTDGTKVFYSEAIAQSNLPDSTGVPFAPDLVNTFSRNGTDRTSAYCQFQFVDRSRGLGIPNNLWSVSTGASSLISSSTASEQTSSNTYAQIKADGKNITRSSGWNSAAYGNWINYFFKRSPGFFDVVCYTGNGSSSKILTHGLKAAPEIIITKARSTTGNWFVYHLGITGAADKPIYLNSTEAAPSFRTGYGGVTPTSTSYYVEDVLNTSSVNYVAYLFASCPGVSKVGSYTGNGSSQTINCGFTNGARFVLIKRTDSTGDWYIWDTARGIVAGNDPHLSLNTTTAEVTTDDTIDPASSGFIVNQVAATNVNVNAATYIYLAIA